MLYVFCEAFAGLKLANLHNKEQESVSVAVLYLDVGSCWRGKAR